MKAQETERLTREQLKEMEYHARDESGLRNACSYVIGRERFAEAIRAMCRELKQHRAAERAARKAKRSKT